MIIPSSKPKEEALKLNVSMYILYPDLLLVVWARNTFSCNNTAAQVQRYTAIH